MALLTLQSLPEGGVPSFVAAAAGGDTIPVGGRGGGWDLGVALVVRNADAATKTVTVDGLPAVIVPASAGTPAVNGIAVIPIPVTHFGIPRSITYSAVLNLAVAAVRLSG